jgi:hypothetical protein
VNRWYPLALQSLGESDVDLETDDIRLLLLDSTAVFNAAHDMLDDVSADAVGTAQAVGTRTMTLGEWETADASVTVTGVAAGVAVGAYVLYVHTGTPSTSRLLVWVDTDANGAAWGGTTTGADIVVAFTPGLLAELVA